MRYRLIKPDWGKPDIIQGPNILEGDDFTKEFLEAKNAQGYNIHFFPNYNSKPLEHPFMRGSDVDLFKSVFVDMDLKDGVYASKELFLEKIDGFSLKPNKIILSGNGVHVYWHVHDLTLKDYLELQLRLIQYFKTDQSVWTAMQLMRVPGYYNTKDQNNYKMVEEIDLGVDPYSTLSLKLELPELTLDNERKIKMHIDRINGIAELENLELNQEEIPQKFLDLLEVNKKAQKLFSAEKGKRSEADFALCGLLYDKGFTRPEAMSVLLNTNKAISKGMHGKSYAAAIVHKVYMEKSEYTVPNAAEKKKSGSMRQLGTPVRGPGYFDCLENPWRSREVLGLIGGTGVGKTSITLDIFYHMIKNNVENDGIFIFFSLELGDEEVIAHWDALTGGDESLTSRLYVIDNQDSEGNHRGLNLQQMYWFIRDIAKATGKKVAAVAIDHVGIINKTIDITQKPDFGLNGREDLGFGKIKTMSDREITRNIKALGRELDCFIVVQSQTTKEKAGEGDVPLGTNAAYGVAQFEWDMDYVMTIWQPLKRVEYKTDMRVSAFQYCKIRKKGKRDRIATMEPRVLLFDVDSKELREMSEDEFEQFVNLNKEASILRKMAEKKESISYTNSVPNNKLMQFIAKGNLLEKK